MKTDPCREGFSPFNSPHLAPAFELDTAIIAFSANLAASGLPTRISTAADVDTLITSLTSSIKALNLWQYYVLDVRREKAAVQERLVSSPAAWTGEAVVGKSVVELADLVRSSGKLDGVSSLAGRYTVRVDPGYASSLVSAAFKDVTNVEGLAEAWGRVVDVLNVPLYEEAASDLNTALEQIKGRLTYTRLEVNGPKLGEITAK